MTWLAYGLIIGGSVLLLIAARGLFVLPDALARQHASTKAATLALTSTLAGVALLGGTPEWWWRVGAITMVLFLTLPVSSHMLARAAARELVGSDALGTAPGRGGSSVDRGATERRLDAGGARYAEPDRSGRL